MKIVSADVTVSSRFRREQRIILFTDHLYNQLFLSRNNGFPIRLRFSLASNHCPDLARDYRIASVSHHEATIPLEKWTVSRFPFPIFPLQPLHPNARKLESFEITILLPLCLSIHPCSIWISICLVLKILVSRSEFLKPSSRRNLLP